MDAIVIIIILLALITDFTAYRFWVKLKSSRQRSNGQDNSDKPPGSGI